MEEKKGWLITIASEYGGNVSEYLNYHGVKNDFSLKYIANDEWSFQLSVPSGFVYMNQKIQNEVQSLYAIENIEVTSYYNLNITGLQWQFYLGLITPTLLKIAGNYSYEGTEKEQRFLAVKPGLGISVVTEPIISFLRFSFSQPIYREYESSGVFSLWTAQLVGGCYFIINDQITFSADLGIIEKISSENYLLQTGIIYDVTPWMEWQVYTAEIYYGMGWDFSMGVSFSLRI